MEIHILQTLEAIGMPVGIAALWMFVYFNSKNHKEERAEWRNENHRLTQVIIESINKNTKILSELSTLIKKK